MTTFLVLAVVAESPVLIMQMSAAWSELDNTTSAEPPNTESIKAAIRQARPFEELKAQVKVAESFLASLERGAERQHAHKREDSAGSKRQQDKAKASEVKALVPKAQQSPGRQSPGKQSPGKQKKTDSKPEAVSGPAQQVEAPQQAESTHQAEAAQQPEDPQQPESCQVPQAPQVFSPEKRATAVQSNAVQVQTIAQQPEAAVDATPAQESHPQLPLQLPPATTPVQSVDEDDTWSSPKQQHDQPQHAADHNTAPSAESAAAVAASAAPIEDSHNSTTTEQDTELAKGTMQTAGASSSADSTPLPDNATSSSKFAEAESQPALSSTQEAVGEAASSQAGGGIVLEANEAATHAASAPSTSTAHAPATAPATAAAPAPGPGSMQDFLSFLLPAENPSAASAMSRATPPRGPSSAPLASEATESAQANPHSLSATGQGGPGRPQAPLLAQAPPHPPRRVKPYTTTARAPVAPYRPPIAAPYRTPGAVYDPTQADGRQPGQGVHPVCLAFLYVDT